MGNHVNGKLIRAEKQRIGVDNKYISDNCFWCVRAICFSIHEILFIFYQFAYQLIIIMFDRK